MNCFLRLSWVLLLALASCHSSAPKPNAAAAISGDYTPVTELTTGLLYPINGKSYSVHIQPLSQDTVQIKIQSDPNAFGPGRNLVYPKVYVGPGMGTVVKLAGREAYQYTLYLTPRPATNLGSLNEALFFYQYGDKHYLDYHYRPIGADPVSEVDDITRLQGSTP